MVKVMLRWQGLFCSQQTMKMYHRPTRFTDAMAYPLLVIEEDVPTTYQKPQTSVKAKDWKYAIDDEIDSLYKNSTWELVSLLK